MMDITKIPIISDKEVKKLLPVKDVIRLMKSALARFSNKSGVIQPVRSTIVIEKPEGFLGVMPAYSSKDSVLATKLVSLFPANLDRPTIQAVILLFSHLNGSVECIMDGLEITTIRTAAVSVVATELLVNSKAETLAILGTGVQARSHALTMVEAIDTLKSIRIWGRNFSKAKQLTEELNDLFLKHGKLSICVAVQTGQDACDQADVVCTVTTSSKAVVLKKWLKPDCHVNIVGAHAGSGVREADDDLMLNSVVYVDSYEASRKEAGDIIDTKCQMYAEIGEVINGMKEAFPQKLTVFKSNGLAIEDAVCARYVFDKYRSKITEMGKL